MGEFNYYHKGFPFYEVYRDGLYMGMHNGCMIARRKITGYTEENVLPMAKEGEEGIKLVIPKIPFKYWYMVWSFYRDINEEHGAEAAVLFYWNDGNKKIEEMPKGVVREYGDGLLVDGKLIIYVPKQDNNGASTKYYGDEMRSWLDANTSVLLDTHSHNSMSAFFSGTDDANEKRFQFYAVYGKVGTENEFILRYRYLDQWSSVDVGELFTEGVVPKGIKGDSTYPKEWLKQCVFNGRG